MLTALAQRPKLFIPIVLIIATVIQAAVFGMIFQRLQQTDRSFLNHWFTSALHAWQKSEDPSQQPPTVVADGASEAPRGARPVSSLFNAKSSPEGDPFNKIIY